MKRAVGVLAMAGCLGLVVSCGGQGGGNPGVEGVPFTDVMCPKISTAAPGEEAGNWVIENQAELEAVWEELDLQASVELPSVDFSQGALVMVYGGQRGTSNEWVLINSIEKVTDGELLVKYDNFTANHPGCGGGGVITFPFCIVQADIETEKLSFQSRELNACDHRESRPNLNGP